MWKRLVNHIIYIKMSAFEYNWNETEMDVENVTDVSTGYLGYLDAQTIYSIFRNVF